MTWLRHCCTARLLWLFCIPSVSLGQSHPPHLLPVSPVSPPPRHTLTHRTRLTPTRLTLTTYTRAVNASQSSDVSNSGERSPARRGGCALQMMAQVGAPPPPNGANTQIEEPHWEGRGPIRGVTPPRCFRAAISRVSHAWPCATWQEHRRKASKQLTRAGDCIDDLIALMNWLY
eukprot:6345222-Prymnesium_polylepis.1